jgi:hypothetical protein
VYSVTLRKPVPLMAISALSYSSLGMLKVTYSRLPAFRDFSFDTFLSAMFHACVICLFIIVATLTYEVLVSESTWFSDVDKRKISL